MKNVLIPVVALFFILGSGCRQRGTDDARAKLEAQNAALVAEMQQLKLENRALSEKLKRLSETPEAAWASLLDDLGSAKDFKSCTGVIQAMVAFSDTHPTQANAIRKSISDFESKCFSLKEREEESRLAQAPLVISLIRVEQVFDSTKITFEVRNQSGKMVDKFWVNASVSNRDGKYVGSYEMLNFSNIRAGGAPAVSHATWDRASAAEIKKVSVTLHTLQVEGQFIEGAPPKIAAVSKVPGVEIEY